MGSPRQFLGHLATSSALPAWKQTDRCVVKNHQKLGELVIHSLLSKTHFVETYFKKNVQPLDCCGFSWIKNNIEHTQMPTRFQQPFCPMLNIPVPQEFSGPCCALVVSKRIQLQNGAPQSQVGLNPINSGYIP